MSVYSYLETVARVDAVGDAWVTVVAQVDLADAPIVNVWVNNCGAKPLTGAAVESSMDGVTWEAEAEVTGLDTLAANSALHKTYGPTINRYWRVRVKAATSDPTNVEVRLVRGNTVGPRITMPLILTPQDEAGMVPL